MKVIEPQSEQRNSNALTVEQRAEGERNLVRLLGIAKRQGVPAAMQEWDRMMDEMEAAKAKDHNSPAA